MKKYSKKINEEFILRGMSAKAEGSYLCAFRIFLGYCKNRDMVNIGEEDIRKFLFHHISIGKSTDTVNIYNCALRLWRRAKNLLLQNPKT